MIILIISTIIALILLIADAINDYFYIDHNGDIFINLDNNYDYDGRFK